MRAGDARSARRGAVRALALLIAALAVAGCGGDDRDQTSSARPPGRRRAGGRHGAAGRPLHAERGGLGIRSAAGHRADARLGSALRGRAARPRAPARRRRARGHVAGHARPRAQRRRAGPARPCLPPGFEQNGRLFAHYTNTQGDTRVDEYRVTAGWPTPPAAPRAPGRRAALPEPQRRAALVRPRRAALPRARRRRLAPWTRTTTGRTRHGAPGQAAANGRGRRRRGRGSRWPTACATRGASRVDRETGSLWIADVGQDEREEIDAVAELPDPPLNFGWPAFEGGTTRTGASRPGRDALCCPWRSTTTTRAAP